MPVVVIVLLNMLQIWGTWFLFFYSLLLVSERKMCFQQRCRHFVNEPLADARSFLIYSFSGFKLDFSYFFSSERKITENKSYENLLLTLTPPIYYLSQNFNHFLEIFGFMLYTPPSQKLLDKSRSFQSNSISFSHFNIQFGYKFVS